MLIWRKAKVQCMTMNIKSDVEGGTKAGSRAEAVMKEFELYAADVED